MTLFQRTAAWLAKRSGLGTPADWLLRLLSGGRRTSSGVLVSPRTAYQCAALVAGFRILAESVASLPLKVYERIPNGDKRLPNGGKQPAYTHPLYSVLSLSPNEEQTSFEWREGMMLNACAWGNSYDQLILDGKGNVAEIWPLDPGKMRVVRPREGGPKEYEFSRGNGSPRMFTPDELLHISLMSDGLKGRSLVDLCHETVGLTLTAEEFAATFFANDATPRLIMEMEGGGPQQVKEMSSAWNETHKGAENKHKVGWLYGGMKAKLLEADLSKLQLLDVRRFQIEEICRMLRIPLHLMQSLERATNNNIEHQGIDFVVHSIRPWLVRIEQRISKSLFGPREAARYFAEFSVDGLLRGDYVSRTTGYGRLIASGMMTPNEGRALENMNPIEGGDKLYIQGAMVPLDQAGVTKKKPQVAA
jgi:HK97 family phage portal protein